MDPRVAFRPCPLVFGALPSYVFPTCEPYDGKDAWCLPPRERLTLGDIKRAIAARYFRHPVYAFHTISLQMKPPRANGVWWRPLQGGPNSALEPEAIQAICDEIMAWSPSVFILHCTHGLNRPLLVVAALYLLHHRDQSVDRALFFVRTIRPPGILRANVVDALRTWRRWEKKRALSKQDNQQVDASENACRPKNDHQA